MTEFIHGNCPKCGRELQIPSDLEEFSCLYCGERCRTEVMLALASVPEGQYGAERDYLRENLPRAAVNYPTYHKKITKKEFFIAFETYENDNAQTMEHLDICARMAPEGREECIQSICKELLDAIEEHLTGNINWEKKSKRSDLLFNMRVVLAIFLTPLVRKRKLETAELFCTQLNQQWLKRWPDQKWIPGDYDELAKGFKQRKLCFITTATCLHEGKADDCAELTAFRSFRDGWLSDHGGQVDILTYYDVAPSIVTCIELCDDTQAKYAEIRQKWLDPCYRALLEHRNEDCREIYTDMVQTLRKEYAQ